MSCLIEAFKSGFGKITGAIRNNKRMLVIGSGNELNLAYNLLAKDRRNTVSAVHINNILIGGIMEFANTADSVYICSGVDYNMKEKIINQCTEINKAVFIIPRIYETALANARVKYFGDLLVLQMGNAHLTKKREFIKRTFDIIIAVIGIITALPLMLFTAVLIKLQDGGAVFFRQERLTKDGKTFTLYKFRTMAVDAERHTGPVLAAKNDHRITPVGRILRDTRIDELPQLFNVIKGEMSMVGPRPERPHFASKYSESIPEFHHRLAVKAGITGLAQVYGKYSISPENKLRFDMFYIKNYSLWLDIWILIKTVGVVFKRDYSPGVKISSEVGSSLNEYNSDAQVL